MTHPLAYDDAGKGIPLVLLHGFPVDRRMWEAQSAELSKHCRVIRLDLRGFGQSKSRQAFSVDDLAADVWALLKSIDALPAVLCGWSMGGYTSFALARAHPDALRGLILIDTKAEADNADQKAAREKMMALVRASGSAAIADQMIPKQLSAGTIASRPGVVAQLRDLMVECDPLTIEHGLAAMRDRRDQTDLLPTLRIASLILVGDGDSITPPAVAESMKSRIPGSRLTIIIGAGHAAPIEQASQVTQAMREFIQTLGKA